MKFLADLFKGVNNNAWDLARILSAISLLSVMAMGGYKIYAGQQLSLAEYANGLMTVMTGCAIFIGAKDVARGATNKLQGDSTVTTTTTQTKVADAPPA